ncbi:MAG: hypothetical protein EP343_34025 [Deltaproteobacteria bacterium]|nr:MAG: hypothetical protein EP343_34025 [Deltaproteobacteria bacterium]
MKLSRWFMIGALLSVLCVGGLACGVIDDLVDCDKICNRYKTCFDSEYNVASCRDRCFNQSRNNAEYNRRANDCSACIETRACASSAFACGVTCIGIVP